MYNFFSVFFTFSAWTRFFFSLSFFADKICKKTGGWSYCKTWCWWSIIELTFFEWIFFLSLQQSRAQMVPKVLPAVIYRQKNFSLKPSKSFTIASPPKHTNFFKASLKFMCKHCCCKTSFLGRYFFSLFSHLAKAKIPAPTRRLKTQMWRNEIESKIVFHASR